MEKASVTFTVNGREVAATVDPRTLLVHFLREELKLTGTHIGCDTSQCGACTIHLNGRPVKSCALLAVQLEGAEVTTIEGIAGPDRLHPMQASFKEHHGLQCGFCTPGMVMMGIDIANRHEAPDEATIRSELEGNLCRCTGYHNIVESVAAGAKASRAHARGREASG